jgi:CubicO group peptidase (beta-lactamase class C family)
VTVLLERHLSEGQREGVFSHACAVVRRHGEVVFEGGTTDPHAFFDLASLTKVMCTTAVLSRLAEQRVLSFDMPLGDFVPAAHHQATLADLAFHRSGLPAFLPFFAELTRTNPTLFDGRAEPGLREAVRREVVRRALAVKPQQQVGTAAVYSDLGFIALGEVVAAAMGLPLEAAFANAVTAPLRLTAHFRCLSAPAPTVSVVPTGGTRPRAPAPGQESMWSCPSFPSREGEVDDDNAWVMNGVAGHAGLFSNANDVAAFGQAVLDGFLGPHPFVRDLKTPLSTRAFGFDTPSPEGASCGPRFGRGGPRGAVGHLGFTGTSLWIDLDRQLVVALLTNRVIFGRENLGIRAFRPRFHEAVIDLFG